MTTRSNDVVTDVMRQNICKNLSAKLPPDASRLEDVLQQTKALLADSLLLQQEREIEAVEASQAFIEGKSRLVSEGEATLSALQASLTEAATCLRSAAPYLRDMEDESLAEAEETLKEVRNAEMRIDYLKWLELFQEQSDRIRSALACDSVADAMAFLQTLVDWCRDFRSSDCYRLVEYLHDVTIYWTNLVGEHIARDLPTMLSRIGFPRPPSSQKQQAVAVDLRSRSEVADIAMLLMRLRLPEFVKSSVPNADVAFLHNLLPMKFFLTSFEKRFRFHFFVSQKTNQLEKPEWYFTQLVSWIRDHADFLADILQPVFRAEGSHSVKSDFAMSLVVLGRAKFLSTLPSLLEDEGMFTHAMDEVLTFSRTLKNLGYENVQRSFCEILLLPEVFKPWFEAEKTLAEDRLNVFLTSSTAWKCQYEEEAGSPEDFKVAECAQQFVVLLKGMSERYELLPSRERQLDFVSLQLDCVESFNERLKLYYEENQDDTYQCARQILPTLATATKYIGDSLEEMASTPVMVELLSQSTPSSVRKAKDVPGRMSNVTEECNRLAKESYLNHLRNDTLDAVRELVREFAKQGWKSMPSVTEFLVPSMTPAMGELLYVMKTIVASQRDRLFALLYTRYVNTLMDAVDRLFLEEVVYDNAFSSGGASQLKYDILNNFVVVMNRLTHLPTAGLTRTVEACNVLSMNRGSAMLLTELLEEGLKSDKKQTDDVKNALHEMNLFVLKADEVKLILRRRSDLDLSQM